MSKDQTVCISFMSKDQTVCKLSQDPDFADGWTIGQMEGKSKVPSSETPVGD